MTSLLIEEEETQIKTRVVEHEARSLCIQIIVAENAFSILRAFASQGISLPLPL